MQPSMASQMYLLVILAGAAVGLVPDEQRLYTDLMYGYESSVRPVLNASKTIMIHFRLTLNQVIDLNERTQVLTTNVIIDQEWEDEKLKWDSSDYNGIRSLRVPAPYVWLPDTFIFNNADDGSTGFMQGVYVLLNENGTVLWPVPVKLKSSCKVDIAYFPFDDQQCILRFGSWIYSGAWMDFSSDLKDIDLESYIDNSEWELLTVNFEKGMRTYACCPDPHPDLTFTLHMRRRTFYYLFNIIVPCMMLSVLTLLTFWLPTTSGEKISLGLSVFLAFSMFMLLIAEEVPATSESIPLIGIYLTTVMTMTSVSVVMAVMVINLYNRGSKARRAPEWLKTLVLRWICRLMRMTHDIDRLTKSIRLDDEEEAKYYCPQHMFGRGTLWADSAYLSDQETVVIQAAQQSQRSSIRSSQIEIIGPDYPGGELSRRFGKIEARKRESLRRERSQHSQRPRTVSDNGGYDSDTSDDDGAIWRMRPSFKSKIALSRRINENGTTTMTSYPPTDACYSRSITEDEEVESEEEVMLKETVFGAEPETRSTCVTDKQSTIQNMVLQVCRKEQALQARKLMIVEWHTIATVIDRLLFWIFLMATVGCYVVILLIIPYSHASFPDDVTAIHLLKRS